MKKFVIVAFPLILFSCAPVSPQQEYDKRISDLEIRLAKIEENHKEIERKLEEINKRIDLLTEEIGRLKLAKIQQEEVEKERKEIVKEKVEVEPIVEDIKIEYEDALNLYRLKRLFEARDAFTKFIKNYKPNPYTDNAYFWLGKIYYELGNSETARRIFNTLIKKCENGELPDCNKLPDTYVMLVKISLDEGDIEEANEYISILESKFPKSEATKRALKLFEEYEEQR